MTAPRGPCPYCRRGRPEVSYEKREHVIPQAFGKFKDNLIARNVCDECNAYFGRELDEVLARGTLEGWWRHVVGDKPFSNYRHAGTRSRLSVHGESGPWKHMHLHYVPCDTGPRVEVTKQVGFSDDDGGDATYYTLDNVPLPDEVRARFGSPYHVFCEAFADADEARGFLASLGFPVEGVEMVTDTGVIADEQPIRVENRSRIDSLVFRAVMKIALNYLDSVCPGLLRLDSLEPACRFVRFGEPMAYQPVKPSRGRGTHGHTVFAAYDPDARQLVAIVSLYGLFDYKMVLAIQPMKLNYPPSTCRSAHFFDTKTKTASPASLPGELFPSTK